MVVDGNEETLENIRVRGHVPKLTLLVELKSGGMTESNYLLNIEETQKFDWQLWDTTSVSKFIVKNKNKQMNKYIWELRLF